MIFVKVDKEDTPGLMLKCHPGTEASTITEICMQIAEKVNDVPLPPRNAHLTEKKPERPVQPKPRLPGTDERQSVPTATKKQPKTVAAPSRYERYPDELPDEEEDEIFSLVYFEEPEADCHDGNVLEKISESDCLQAL
ncbi:uncharacterized protein LOC111360819 [Spodoptera litura]|uniref:Uncharacterized protein LOC111360819 n=1 Tax=Spodoptera litura TaxID=69820 RepID=A0A9J7ELV9_SPOLT|nr:uncharacterized protein LOC111360819 [Spodoptera litura]